MKKPKPYNCECCKNKQKIKQMKTKFTIYFIDGMKVCKECYFAIKSKNNHANCYDKIAARKEALLYIR